MLRIRDNGKVRELNIPKDKLEVLQKIVSSPKTTDDIKKMKIKELANASPCCTCGGLPSHEVIYQLEGATDRTIL